MNGWFGTPRSRAAVVAIQETGGGGYRFASPRRRCDVPRTRHRMLRARSLASLCLSKNQERTRARDFGSEAPVAEATPHMARLRTVPAVLRRRAGPISHRHPLAGDRSARPPALSNAEPGQPGQNWEEHGPARARLHVTLTRGAAALAVATKNPCSKASCNSHSNPQLGPAKEFPIHYPRRLYNFVAYIRTKYTVSVQGPPGKFDSERRWNTQSELKRKRAAW